MWRRLVYSQLKILASPSSSVSTSWRLAPKYIRFVAQFHIPASPCASLSASHFSSISADTSVKRRIENIMPIVTGHEREEMEAEIEGRELLGINYPIGPFGTKEEPAVIKSYYDKRIIGCPGGEGEDEHDVVWFWLEKGKSLECPVCSQHFVLEVVGPGGSPDGHGDENHHH